MPDLAKPEGYKLILLFLEEKRYKKDALAKRLLANRWYEAISRRPGQTLQDFFATENMAYADAVKAGVRIDPDRRAHHMFIRSGLTDDTVNHGTHSKLTSLLSKSFIREHSGPFKHSSVHTRVHSLMHSLIGVLTHSLHPGFNGSLPALPSLVRMLMAVTLTSRRDGADHNSVYMHLLLTDGASSNAFHQNPVIQFYS